MTRISKKILLFVILAALSLSVLSCGSEPKAILSMPGSTNTDGCLTVYVSSNVETIDFYDYMIFNAKSKVKFYNSEEMKDEISSIVSLKTGDNIFYVKVKEKLTKNEYKINFIRRDVHSVTFDSNGGTPCPSVFVDHGLLLNPPVTTKPGYDFVGWGYDFAVPVNENLSLVAQWAPKKFAITSNDFETIEVAYGTEYTLPTVSKVGYKFMKWIDGNGNVFPTTGIWTSESNVNVSGVFEKEVYNITYVLGASLPNQSGTYTVDDEVSLFIPTAPEGLNFLGWYIDLSNETPVTKINVGTVGNQTFYAKWIADEEIEHKITINASGHEIDGDQISVFFGSAYNLPVVQNREGYTHSWMLNGNEIPSSGIWALKDDGTVSLTWTPITYSLTYGIDERTSNPNTIVEFTVESAIITLLNPVRPNAEFLGWYTTPDFKEDTLVTEISAGTVGDIVLYPKFFITYYSVTYNPNGGEVDTLESKFEIGAQYQLPIPTNVPGLAFAGWYTNVDDETTKIENSLVWSLETDLDLVAKWVVVEYTIVLNSNGTKKEIKYTMNDSFELETPTATGFIFMGWKETGSTSAYQRVVINKGTTGNKEYTAVFSRFEYTLDATNKTATASRFIRTYGVSEVVIPTHINVNGVEYTVTALGAELFRNMSQFFSKYSQHFSVEIPKTLLSIGENAFTNCTDVQIHVILDKGVDVNIWADSLIVASGNDQVVDVIKARRPAIGWSIYG